MTRASCRKLNETEKRKHDPKENHDRLGGSENKFWELKISENKSTKKKPTKPRTKNRKE